MDWEVLRYLLALVAALVLIFGTILVFSLVEMIINKPKGRKAIVDKLLGCIIKQLRNKDLDARSTAVSTIADLSTIKESVGMIAIEIPEKT